MCNLCSPIGGLQLYLFALIMLPAWTLLAADPVAFDVPWYTLIPFGLMLLSIAILPIFAHEWWDVNRNKLIIATSLSIPILIFIVVHQLYGELSHAILDDYIPFIVLLGGLFAVTGNIYISGDIEATPRTNTAILTLGALIASLVGTTGAALLLIRLLLQTNQERSYKQHTVLFFIALVANCGGLMTPLGDPPLFLLYLRGVPFEWFAGLLPNWLLVNVLLLISYFLVDSYYHRREPVSNLRLDKESLTPINIRGAHNFVFLLGIVLGIAFLNPMFIPALGKPEYGILKYSREFFILSMALGAFLTTKSRIRKSNGFNWHPIEEVAALFVGIFITMIPCLMFLEQVGQGLGISEMHEYYFLTGIMSSFLDNAPTAVIFYKIAQLASDAGAPDLVAGVAPHLLAGISEGAVFFGAMTYIGNGPNFMVKAIAERFGVKMPSFFGYIGRFAVIYLLPIFILNGLLNFLLRYNYVG
jgi:Na+/H+ antiporter NhaD/arsenite permease-like protein